MYILELILERLKNTVLSLRFQENVILHTSLHTSKVMCVKRFVFPFSYQSHLNPRIHVADSLFEDEEKSYRFSIFNKNHTSLLETF